MIVLVCGGREFGDYDLMDKTLADLVPPGAKVITGAARGADRMASGWARANGRELREFPADWRKYGRGAGPKRNQEMLEAGRPDLVIAFDGGAGTRDMVDRARRAGIRVVAVTR